MAEPAAPLDWVFGFGSIMNNLSRAATSGDRISALLTYDLKGWATAPEALVTLENNGKLGAIHIFF